MSIARKFNLLLLLFFDVLVVNLLVKNKIFVTINQKNLHKNLKSRVKI